MCRSSGREPARRRVSPRSGRIPPSLDSGADLLNLFTSTPSGRTVVLLNTTSTVPTYQVWTLTGGWTTPGLVPLELCSSDTCNISISPNWNNARGHEPLGAPGHRPPRAGQRVVGNDRKPGRVPEGQRGLRRADRSLGVELERSVRSSWSTRSTDRLAASRCRSERPTGSRPWDPIRPDSTTSRSSSGDSGCPCRAVVLDAATGNVVRNVALGATTLDRIDNEGAVGVALNDDSDVVAVTFDNNLSTSGSHRAALATYSLDNGQPLQVAENKSLGLGTQAASVPAFQPGTDAVALVATRGSSREVGGVLVDARTLAMINTFGMRSGVVTVDTHQLRQRRLRAAVQPERSAARVEHRRERRHLEPRIRRRRATGRVRCRAHIEGVVRPDRAGDLEQR